ncbi:hypothetical protein GCM10009760_21130 [Kitasatospora kazusensis]|uniref:SMI1/KNR4 family protein n=1 Tax=Kitasatospora kazusensis TaxID=407974 RepID=A0ABN2ZAF8_9ACTN
MGASGWDYYVPYQEDLGAALSGLRRKVFAEGDYHWVRDTLGSPEAEVEAVPRPRTMAELWEDEWVQESGTHSILDMFRIVGPGEEPDYGTVQPLSVAESRACAGDTPLTRAHVKALEGLPTRRWFGRCAVLHDERGEPQEIYFWGHSGD